MLAMYGSYYLRAAFVAHIIYGSGGSRISKRGGRAKRAAKFGPAHILYINGARARPSHEQNRTRTSELAKFRGGI